MESLRKLISRFRAGFKAFKKAGQGEMTVTAVITRADGTVEDLGILSKGMIRDWKTEKLKPSEVNNASNSSNE